MRIQLFPLILIALLVSSALALIGSLNILATVQFYKPHPPKLITYNFVGNETNPTIVYAGTKYVFKAQFDVDPDTKYLGENSSAYINGERYALYWDADKNIAYTPSVVIERSKLYHVEMHITFQRISNKTIYTFDLDGYVYGGYVEATFYIVSMGVKYDITHIGKYQVVHIPIPSNNTIKFLVEVSKGGDLIDKITIKIWRHRSGVPLDEYEKLYKPDYTVNLNQKSTSTWINNWRIPKEGIYIINGYIKLKNGDWHKQLAITSFTKSIQTRGISRNIVIIASTITLITTIILLINYYTCWIIKTMCKR